MTSEVICIAVESITNQRPFLHSAHTCKPQARPVLDIIRWLWLSCDFSMKTLNLYYMLGTHTCRVVKISRERPISQFSNQEIP